MKKPTYKQLADYLGVSEQAVKQYPKVKRYLMLLGLQTVLQNVADLKATKDK